MSIDTFIAVGFAVIIVGCVLCLREHYDAAATVVSLFAIITLALGWSGMLTGVLP